MATLNDAFRRLFYTSNSQAADVGNRIPILDANNTPIGNDTYANIKNAMGLDFRSISTLSKLPAVWKIWDNGGGNKSVVLKIVAHRVSVNFFYGSVEMIVGGVGTSDRTKVISADCVDANIFRLYKKIEEGVYTYYVRLDTSLSSSTNRVSVTQLTGNGNIDAPELITDDVQNVEEYNFSTGEWVAKTSINA